MKLQHTVDKHIITCYTDVKWLIQNVGTAHGISCVHHKFCCQFMQQNQLKPNQQFFPLKPLSKNLLWNKALNPLNNLKFYSIPEKIPLENQFPLSQSDELPVTDFHLAHKLKQKLWRISSITITTILHSLKPSSIHYWLLILLNLTEPPSDSFINTKILSPLRKGKMMQLFLIFVLFSH